MIRIIAVDFGTSTSVIYYADYDEKAKNFIKKSFIEFQNQATYVPTLLMDEQVIERKGKQNRISATFGWDVYNRDDQMPYWIKDFKMGLISPDTHTRQEAVRHTERFFRELFESYRDGQISDQITDEKTYVTYPAKFPLEVANVLKEAAEKAGFPKVTMVNEAEAAVLMVLNNETHDSHKAISELPKQLLNVMLIDMGAGTTDVGVFRYDFKTRSNFELLGYFPKNGTLNFGGHEIDDLLTQYYIDKLGDWICGSIVPGNPVFGKEILRYSVKDYKDRPLSEALRDGETPWNLPGKLDSIKYEAKAEHGINNIADVVNIDREIFETEILKNYLPQFPKIIRGALDDAKLTAEEIDLVFLTGGHSQWYFVRDYLTGNREDAVKLPKIAKDRWRIVAFPNPHTIVAQGAIYGEQANRQTPKEETAPKEDGKTIDVKSTEDPKSLFEQGLVYETNGQYEEAVQLYQKAAGWGYATAQYYLGVAYYNGRGVQQNKVQAVNLYRKAADQDYADAQYDLGLAYEEGVGVQQSTTAAVEWYRKAANKGHQGAAKRLKNLTAYTKQPKPKPQKNCKIEIVSGIPLSGTKIVELDGHKYYIKGRESKTLHIVPGTHRIRIGKSSFFGGDEFGNQKRTAYNFKPNTTLVIDLTLIDTIYWD